MNIEVNTNTGEILVLNLVQDLSTEGFDYVLVSAITHKGIIGLYQEDNHFRYEILDSLQMIDVSDFKSKLDELFLKILEIEQSGTEYTEGEIMQDISPYDPDKIKVTGKAFSIKLIKDMIDGGDIDMNPDFQRNFVWNSFQKSRLIESILLRIPLPMFYFSEDEEGRLSVIDGLQRLTTINEFMDNKFPLQNLEYLGESCNNRYYKDDDIEASRQGIDAKYFRWFNLTQITGNVIDPSSPAKVKYDIFRRINTGGKPLNNQEIRNCLAGKALRRTLRKMVDLPIFREATDYSIKPTRMNDQEVALRFILFHRLHQIDDGLDNYTGNIETLLDNLTEDLLKSKESDLEIYVTLFSNAMHNGSHLFGNRYAFRKVTNEDILPYSKKQLINKALFVSWSVLLSQFEPESVTSKNQNGILLKPLANAISNDGTFMYYLSSGTNGKANIQFAFSRAKELINEYLDL